MRQGGNINIEFWWAWPTLLCITSSILLIQGYYSTSHFQILDTVKKVQASSIAVNAEVLNFAFAYSFLNFPLEQYGFIRHASTDA